jgi:Ca2+-binding EF-hand superfamily protein
MNQGIKIDWLEEGDGEKLAKFINKYDKDRDGKLNYLEFTKAITPKNSQYTKNYNRYGRGYISEKDQQIRQREWIDELGKVIETAISSEIILETIRNDLNLDGDSVFSAIDSFNLGYISTGIFTRWVSDNCGYRVSEDEVTFILNRYDKDQDYRIKRDEFLSET